MKKLLIGAAAAVVIAGGGYFAMNKAGSIADTAVTQLIADHTNKPLTVDYLQSYPFIDKATWEITQSNENHIDSVLHLALIDGETVDIPLVSQIIRGKTEHNGKSYGFGKIVTHPNLNQTEDLPPQITNDTLTVTKYIGLDGSITAVNNIKPLKIETLDFQGLTSTFNSSLLDLSTFDMDFKTQKISLSVEETDETITLSPMTFTMKMDKNGAYTGQSEPVSINIAEMGQQAVNIAFGKGNYSGIYKAVEGLNVPLNNGKGVWDTATVSAQGTEVQLNNVVLDAGFYEAGDQLADMRLNLSAGIAAQSLQELGMDITPEHIDVSYALNQLSYQAINAYYSGITTWSEDLEGELTDNQDFKVLLSEMQRNDSNFTLGFNVKATEGTTDAKAMVQFSDSGKAVPIDTLLPTLEDNPEQLIQWIAANATVVMDEPIADISGLAMMLQMMLGITPENGKYTINAEIKDGQALVNGQPMM